MAVLYPCLNFGAATLLVTAAWVCFGRNLSFGTLSVVMYFPTLVALLFMAVNNDGEFWQFFSRTIGAHHFLQPDKVTVSPWSFIIICCYKKGFHPAVGMLKA